MILAISRFKVANGLEQEVKEAFFHRPHLVDQTPGFLGMETFTQSASPSIFYLLTRWTDKQSFEQWHHSAAHRASHHLIPKGLKLDAAFTEVLVLDRIASSNEVATFETEVTDAAGVVTQFLTHSRTTHFLHVASDGTIRACNAMVAESLKVPLAELIGQSLWNYLTEENARAFAQLATPAQRQFQERIRVNFVDAHNIPYTLECYMDCQPDGFLVIGEPPQKNDSALQEQLLQLNNELATLTRENIRKSKALKKTTAELEKTLQELNDSYWHLEKISELLPMCMYCRKVRNENAEWGSIVDYLNKHSRFISHSCCPECYEKVMATIKERNDHGTK